MSRDRALQGLCAFVFFGTALNVGSVAFVEAGAANHGWDRFDMYAMAALCTLAYLFISYLFVFRWDGRD